MNSRQKDSQLLLSGLLLTSNNVERKFQSVLDFERASGDRNILDVVVALAQGELAARTQATIANRYIRINGKLARDTVQRQLAVNSDLILSFINLAWRDACAHLNDLWVSRYLKHFPEHLALNLLTILTAYIAGN